MKNKLNEGKTQFQLAHTPDRDDECCTACDKWIGYGESEVCTPITDDERLLSRLELTHSLVLQSSKNLAVDIKGLKKRFKKLDLNETEELCRQATILDQLEEGEERLRVEEFGLRDIMKQIRKQIKLDLNRKIG